MNIFICLGAWLLVLLAVGVWLRYAAIEGWEDEDWFHRGPKTGA